MLYFFLAPYRKQSQIFGLSSEEECDERRWKKKKKGLFKRNDPVWRRTEQPIITPSIIICVSSQAGVLDRCGQCEDRLSG